MNNLGVNNYNLMLIGTPDTKDRMHKVKERLVKVFEEDIEDITIPLKQFSDGQWNVKLPKSVEGKHVYVYLDYFSDYSEDGKVYDINSRVMQGEFLFDAINRHGAKTLNLIAPKYPYARSDKSEDKGLDEDTKRTPIMAKKIADRAERARIRNYITLDIHNPSIEAFFNGTTTKCRNLSHGWVIKKAILSNGGLTNRELGSTDLGGAKKIDNVSSSLGINRFVGDKSRDRTIANSVAKISVLPGSSTINGMDVMLYDDMLDTGGTLGKFTDKLWEEYKPHSLDAVITHGLFNGEAMNTLDRLHAEGKLRNLYVTDSVMRSNISRDYIKTIFTDAIIAKMIESIVMSKPKDYNYMGD